MTKKIIKFFACSCVFSIIALVVIFYLAIAVWRSKEPAVIEIKSGLSVHKISEELASAHVIPSPKIFDVMVRLKGLDSKLKAGTYKFNTGLTMLEVLNKIESGEILQYPFTLVPGWSIKDIATAFAKEPFANSPEVADEFLRLVRDAQFISKLGLSDIDSLEGYLFPDTYFITKPFHVSDFVERLVSHFNEVWNSLDTEAVDATGLSKKDIVSLASIVEKETGNEGERPLIASVFFNRLKKGMPLQSDPTIIYGLTNFDGDIKKADISNPHPYNTYIHQGIPPGPICSPGRASIEAVLHPAVTNYLYFVSKNDGAHFFSETANEHQKAVEEHQLGKVK